MPFLATGSASTGWGGFSNGMIPSDQLCSLGGRPHAALRRGRGVPVAGERIPSAVRRERCASPTPTARTPSQVELYGRKPSLAALPGTSNHGWGVAVDLCGGVEQFGSAEHQWMVANAAQYGWVHPHWARQGGSRAEPWHWEFGKPNNA